MCRACSSVLPVTSHSTPGVQLKVLEHTIYDLGGSSQQASCKCIHCQTGCHAEKSQHSTTAPQPARMGRTAGRDDCCRCPCRSPRVRRARQPEGHHWLQDGASFAAHAQAARRRWERGKKRREKSPGSLISEPAHSKRMVQNPLASILLLQPLHPKLVPVCMQPSRLYMTIRLCTKFPKARGRTYEKPAKDSEPMVVLGSLQYCCCIFGMRSCHSTGRWCGCLLSSATLVHRHHRLPVVGTHERSLSSSQPACSPISPRCASRIV